jgi:hypothetical protein
MPSSSVAGAVVDGAVVEDGPVPAVVAVGRSYGATVVEEVPAGDAVDGPPWANTAASSRPHAATPTASAPRPAARGRKARRDTSANREPGGPKASGSGAFAAASASIGGP